jgi:hypothetical protein
MIRFLNKVLKVWVIVKRKKEEQDNLDKGAEE